MERFKLNALRTSHGKMTRRVIGNDRGKCAQTKESALFKKIKKVERGNDERRGLKSGRMRTKLVKRKR